MALHLTGSTIGNLSPVFESRRRVDLSSSFSYGAPTDGTDARAAIQAAINDGVPIKFGSKGAGSATTSYDVQGTSLLLHDGTDIEFDPNAAVVKDFASAALFQNTDLTVALNGVRFSGPGRVRAKDFTKTGPMFKVRANYAEFSDFTIDKWAGGGGVMALAGDYVRLKHLRLYGSDQAAGSGGVRFFSGKGFRAYGLHIESGDDCFQFVPSGNPADPWWNIGDIEDGKYIGGYGITSAAKLMVAAMQVGGSPISGDISAGMNANIHGVSWTAIGGKGNAAIIRVLNLNSLGTIDGVRATDCWGDASISSQAGRGAHIVINRGGSATGEIRDVKIDCRVLNPQYSTVKITGGCFDVVIADGRAQRGAQGADLPVLDLTGEVEVRGGEYDGLGSTQADVISVAPNDQYTTPVRALIAPRRVKGIGDGKAGVLLSAGTSPRVSGVAFSPSNSGSTTAVGVKITSTCTGTVIDHNDFGDLAAAVPVNDLATGTLVESNIGVANKGSSYQNAWSAWATKTSAYTALNNDQLLLDTTGGTFAVTLATATSLRAARVRLKWVAGTVPPTLAGGANDPTWSGFEDLGDAVEFVDDGTTYRAV